MSFPPIYVISLARAAARRAAVRERLDALGLGYEVVNAVDGAVADPALYRHRLRQDLARRRRKRELSIGEIGCYLSHYQLWQRIVAEQTECALVLEDDAAPNGDFAAVVGGLLEVGVHWDVVILHTHRAKEIQTIARGVGGTKTDLGRSTSEIYGTAGYLIRPRAARKLLHVCREISEQVDVAWSKWWRTGLAFYCVKPAVVLEAEEESTIETANIKRANRLERTQANIYREWDKTLRRCYGVMNPAPKVRD